MNRLTVYNWIGRSICAALGALVLWTGISKVVTPADFLSSIYSYELLPPQLAMAAAIVLPWVEVLAGICLLGGVGLPSALILCMGMFAAFGLAQASVLHRGLDINCGCGLVPGEHINYWTLSRSIMFLLSTGLAFYCVVYPQKNEQATRLEPITQAI